MSPQQERRQARLQEEIRYAAGLQRLFWLTAVAAIGGAVGLIVGGLSPLRSCFAGFGIAVAMILSVSVLRQHHYIRQLLQHMEDGT